MMLARGISQCSSFLTLVSVRNIARRICSLSSNIAFCKTGREQRGDFRFKPFQFELNYLCRKAKPLCLCEKQIAGCSHIYLVIAKGQSRPELKTLPCPHSSSYSQNVDNFSKQVLKKMLEMGNPPLAQAHQQSGAYFLTLGPPEKEESTPMGQVGLLFEGPNS